MTRSGFLKILGLGAISIPAFIKPEDTDEIKELKAEIEKCRKDPAYLHMKYGTVYDVKHTSCENWSDVPHGDGTPVFMSQAIKNAYGETIDGWTVPLRIDSPVSKYSILKIANG
jgi:hypothetical protein